MKYRFISLVNFQEGNAANEAADKALLHKAYLRPVS